MDTANSIDDTPVMDEKGVDITPESSEIVFDKVDFSYADRLIEGMKQAQGITEQS